MGRALAALAALLVVVTDARPVADPERPFARVRASDDARYSDADAPLMMFPSAQLDGRLWARHADGAWARGEGRWRDANVAMAKYARVHRAVLEAEAEAEADATTTAAGEGGSRRREPRFVVWRGRHLAGCPFPRRLRAAASALALALVTDRAFLVDDPILERLLDLDASGSFPIDVRVPRRAVLDDDSMALSLSTLKTTTTTNKRGNGETHPDTREDPSDDARHRGHVSLPCGGVAGMRASASNAVAVFLADEAIDWTESLVNDPNAADLLRRSGLGEDAADVAGTFMSFLLRPRHAPRGLGSPAMLTTPEGEGEVAGSNPARVVGVHALEDALEYRSDRTEDEEDSGDAEVGGSIPAAGDDPAGELRAWTESCVAALTSPRPRRDGGDDGARKKRGGRLSGLFRVAGKQTPVRSRTDVEGSNPDGAARQVFDVHVAFEDASFSARGAGTVRAWAERVFANKRFGSNEHESSNEHGSNEHEAGSDDASLADLVALTAGSDALVVTALGSDLGGVVSAVWRAVTGSDAYAPGDGCGGGNEGTQLWRGSFGAERAAALARATGRGVVAPARRASRGGEGEC